MGPPLLATLLLGVLVRINGLIKEALQVLSACELNGAPPMRNRMFPATILSSAIGKWRHKTVFSSTPMATSEAGIADGLVMG